MKFPGFMTAVAVVAVVSIQSGDEVNRSPVPEGTGRPNPTLRVKPPEPPSSEVSPGDNAPNFAYQSEDNRWRRLTDLLGQASIVLVFGAEETDLLAMERERDELMRLGVMPVAVLDMRGRAAWSTARRLGLTYPVLPDPRTVISAQFNVLDDVTQRAIPAWFVVDRHGVVRALRRGALPGGDYQRLAANALGLPTDEMSVPSGSR